MLIGKILFRYYKSGHYKKVEFFTTKDGWVIHIRNLSIIYPISRRYERKKND